MEKDVAFCFRNRTYGCENKVLLMQMRWNEYFINVELLEKRCQFFPKEALKFKIMLKMLLLTNSKNC